MLSTKQLIDLKNSGAAGVPLFDIPRTKCILPKIKKMHLEREKNLLFWAALGGGALLREDWENCIV